MAVQTRQHVVDQIKYEVYGGIPGNDVSLSDRFVLTKVNNWIAKEAINNAFANTNIDNLTYSDDIFNLTFKNLALTSDADYDLKVLTLPALPVGLPRQRAIHVFATGVPADLFKPISRFEYQRLTALPQLQKVFYFIENDNAYFTFKYVNPLVAIDTVHMTMTTSGALDLTAKLNMPDDMIDAMKMAIVAELKVMIGTGVPVTK